MRKQTMANKEQKKTDKQKKKPKKEKLGKSPAALRASGGAK
jgi:hypothetical protein